MVDYYLDLLNKYRPRGILVDTNLLLVYFVGRFDSSQIPRFKRTRTYSLEDFNLVAAIVESFSKMVTTPNVLTEVNSFSNQLPEALKVAYYAEFANQITKLEEHFVKSSAASSSPHFAKFGLTDSGIIELVKDQYLVMTDDLKLAYYCQQLGVAAINFNNIRVLNW